MKLYSGDCLNIMPEIPDKSVDMVLCDLPYGLTNCKWDSVIPMDKLWAEYRRILKAKGVCVLFGNQPFTSTLISSNYSEFSHMWYWKKSNATGHLLAKKQPMRCVEDIAVFICNRAINSTHHENLRKYFFDELEKSSLKRKDINKLLNIKTNPRYFTRGRQFQIPSEEHYKILQDVTGCFQRPYKEIKVEILSNGVGGATYTYNPQGIRELDKPRIKIEHDGGIQDKVYRGVKPKTYKQTKTGYPKNLIEFDREKSIIHPTQKPVALLEYLIKTYSNAGETVLDNCMGSGSTGIACVNTNRKFIGIEKDPKYFDAACKRIKTCTKIG